MAIALVQDVCGTGSGSAGAVATIPFTSNVVAGNLLVCCAYLEYPDTQRATITDSRSNTWTAATTAVATGGGVAASLQIFYAVAATSGACTVTMTSDANHTGSSFYYGRIFEFSGCAASSPQDGSGATGTSVGTVALTVASANSLIVAMGINSSASFTPGSGYTAGPTPINTQFFDNTEYRVDAPAGTNNVGFSVSPITALAAAAFKPLVSTVTATVAASETADAASILAGGSARSVSVTLVTSPSDATPRASLSGLKWAFFDAMPWSGAGVAPANVGTTGTTDASGMFSANLTRSTLGAGATGYLVVTDSDGTTSTTPNAFAGPVTVS